MKTIKACDSFKEGLNCCQAVVYAFDNLENQDILIKASTSFGGGIGGMRQVCGAVSGMAIVAGAMYGYNTPTRGEKKISHTQLVQNMCKEFEAVTGSIVCGELLGLDGFKAIDDKNKLPCVDLVALATKIAEENLKKTPND